MKLDKEIVEIKKKGKLIAFDTERQYWLYHDMIYSISVCGRYMNAWCSTDRLGSHLHRLWQVTRRKFFTENSDSGN